VLVLTLNDRGRTELGELIGPSATEVEGRLRAEDDTSYMVNVLAIRYVNGQNNAWAGEALQVRKAHIAAASERELSRTRTLLVSAVAVTAAVVFAITRDLFRSGSNEVEPFPGPGPGET
jgi:hypothetical protein